MTTIGKNKEMWISLLNKERKMKYQPLDLTVEITTIKAEYRSRSAVIFSVAFVEAAVFSAATAVALIELSKF